MPKLTLDKIGETGKFRAIELRLGQYYQARTKKKVFCRRAGTKEKV